MHAGVQAVSLGGEPGAQLVQSLGIRPGVQPHLAEQLLLQLGRLAATADPTSAEAATADPTSAEAAAAYSGPGSC